MVVRGWPTSDRSREHPWGSSDHMSAWSMKAV
jgi:hypothetical protein